MKPIRRKLVIVGDYNTGKTSLLHAYSHGRFPEYYLPVIFEARVEDLMIDDVPVELAFWDTGAREEYERLRPLSYPSTSVVLITFAIDSPKSFLNVSTKWFPEVRQFCGPHLPILLVGCKSDLRDGNPPAFCVVPRKEAETVAYRLGASGYYECSSLRGKGLSEVIEDAARASLKVAH